MVARAKAPWLHVIYSRLMRSNRRCGALYMHRGRLEPPEGLAASVTSAIYIPMRGSPEGLLREGVG